VRPVFPAGHSGAAALLAGKPCGSDAGLAIERIHFKAGIVRECEHRGQAGCFDRLLDGIVTNGGAILDNIRQALDVGRRNNFELEIGQDGADFPQFVLVARGNEKLHGRGLYWSAAKNEGWSVTAPTVIAGHFFHCAAVGMGNKVMP
jgi:hypothetical protein